MKKIQNVLLVDDDVVTCYIVGEIIQEMDIAQHITTVYNGKQALDYLAHNCTNDNGQEFCPAIILLDLKMPIMDGFEFLEAFQTHYTSYIGKIAICIVSSSSAGKDKLISFKYPISGFLTKPLTRENLIPILEMM